MFITEESVKVPAVNESQMREIDRIAVEEHGLGILQMMENAGRNLAKFIYDNPNTDQKSKIAIFCGPGGNGGGGICAARHLLNREYDVTVMISKPASEYQFPAKSQLDIVLKSYPDSVQDSIDADTLIHSDILVDALIGYSLKGAPHGTILETINQINHSGKPVISLDIPSGISSDDGSTPGAFIEAQSTLTLALPKFGLSNSAAGEIYLADIGIPSKVFADAGVLTEPIFNEGYIKRLFIE